MVAASHRTRRLYAARPRPPGALPVNVDAADLPLFGLEWVRSAMAAIGETSMSMRSPRPSGAFTVCHFLLVRQVCWEGKKV